MDTLLACNMAALDTAGRARRQELAAHLQTATQEVLERPDGFAFRYPADTLFTAAEFITLEMRCCPFFRFRLDVAPDGGPLWLAITGGEGVKAFLVAELGPALGVAGAP
ncbi:MAG: hypothetical protein ACR2JY_20700 [Chloroflexota bacterium]